MGSDARLTDPLRYKQPGEQASNLIELPTASEAGEADDDTRFATGIAGFGPLLQGGTYLGDWSCADAIRLAAGAKGRDPYGYRAEAVILMRLAESLDR